MAQKLWQYRSWGALAGEHKHKQRQTPSRKQKREWGTSCERIPWRGLLCQGYEGRRMGGWRSCDWGRMKNRRRKQVNRRIDEFWGNANVNAKNKGASTGSATLAEWGIASLYCTLYYPCFYVFMKLWWEGRRQFSLFFIYEIKIIVYCEQLRLLLLCIGTIQLPT